MLVSSSVGSFDSNNTLLPFPKCDPEGIEMKAATRFLSPALLIAAALIPVFRGPSFGADRPNVVLLVRPKPTASGRATLKALPIGGESNMLFPRKAPSGLGRKSAWKSSESTFGSRKVGTKDKANCSINLNQ